MIKFEFESHDKTIEDQYVKEVVTFKFTAEGESWYVPYFHKATKEGGSFWSPASAGVQIDGKKKYFDGFELDSRHRQKQILEFLAERKWEKEKSIHHQQAAPAAGAYYPHGMAQNTQPLPDMLSGKQTSISEVAANDNLPF